MMTVDQVSTVSPSRPENGNVVYATIPSCVFPVSRSDCVLFGEGLEGGVAVPMAVSFVLALCASARTLAEHERLVSAHMRNASERDVKALLAALIKDGLLSPVELSHATTPRRLDTVVIRTADQPALFERCVLSFVRQMRSGETRILVIDHSVDPRASDANRAIVHDTAAEAGDVPIDYVGRAEVARLQTSLTRIGAGPDELSFLHAGDRHVIDRTAAARNLAVLLTAGERILLVNESSFCSAWVSPRPDRGLRIAGHGDPRWYEFYQTRQESLRAPERCNGDELLDAHSGLLGRGLLPLLESHADHDMSDACSHMRMLLTSSDEAARVRVTAGGIAGDSGIDCPYTLLFKNGLVHRQLLGSRDAFDAAFWHHGARRLSDQIVVTHVLECDLQCIGIDNSALVPPLPGTGRGAGTVFGTLLQALDPGALMAYAPIGIVDDPAASAAANGGRIESASRVTSPEVFQAALGGFGLSSVVATTAAERAHQVGRHLSAVGRSGYHDWRNAIRVSIIDRRASMLRDDAAHRAAPGSDDAPYWTAADSKYRAAFVAALESPRFFVPPEFDHIPDTRTALTAIGDWMARFGDFLQLWPALWSWAAHNGTQVPTRYSVRDATQGRVAAHVLNEH